MKEPFQVKDGYSELTSKPGPGIELDVDFALLELHEFRYTKMFGKA